MKKMHMIIAIAFATASFTAQSLATTNTDIIFVNNSPHELAYFRTSKKIEKIDDFVQEKNRTLRKELYMGDYAWEPYFFIRPVAEVKNYDEIAKPIGTAFYDLSDIVQQAIKETPQHKDHTAVITIAQNFSASLTWKSNKEQRIAAIKLEMGEQPIFLFNNTPHYLEIIYTKANDSSAFQSEDSDAFFNRPDLLPAKEKKLYTAYGSCDNRYGCNPKHCFVRPVKVSGDFNDIRTPIGTAFYNLSDITQQVIKEQDKYKGQMTTITIAPDFTTSVTREPFNPEKYLTEEESKEQQNDSPDLQSPEEPPAMTTFINNTNQALEYVEKSKQMGSSFSISKDNKQNENMYHYLRGQQASIRPVTVSGEYGEIIKPIGDAVYDISDTVQKTIKDWNKDIYNTAVITISPSFKASLTWKQREAPKPEDERAMMIGFAKAFLGEEPIILINNTANDLEMIDKKADNAKAFEVIEPGSSFPDILKKGEKTVYSKLDAKYCFIRPITVKGEFPREIRIPVGTAIYNLSDITQQAIKDQNKHKGQMTTITIAPDFSTSLTREPFDIEKYIREQQNKK
jgi:hypothetical protein